MSKNGLTEITPTDGNIFADTGFEPAEAINLKRRADLMAFILIWIRDNNYTQAKAAKILGVGRPEVSDLKRGKVRKFSIDKLVNMLHNAGYVVKMEVQETVAA